MTLGNVLLRPQRFARAARAARGVDSEVAIGEELLAIVVRILLNPERAAPLLTVLSDAAESSADRFQARVRGRFDAAGRKLRALTKPYEDFAAGFAPSGELTAANAVTQLRSLLDQAAAAVSSLTTNRLQQQLQPIVDIIVNDLGITPDVIEVELWQLVDDIISALQNGPADAGLDERRVHRDLARVLRRMRNRFRASFRFPAIDVRPLVAELMRALERTGIDQVLRQTACRIEKVGAGIESIDELIRTISSELGGDSVGAAATATDAGANAGEFSWYGTWLLESKGDDLPFFEPDDLKDPGGLVLTLKAPATETDAFVFDELSEAQKEVLNAYTSGEPSDEIRFILLELLNKLVTGSRGLPLYDLTSFVTRRDDLHAKTNEISLTYSKDQELFRFNRMVLEDLFKNFLEQMPRDDIGVRFFQFWKSGWWTPIPGKLLNALIGVFAWPGDQLRVDASGRRVLLGNKIVHAADDVHWYDAPLFDSGTQANGGQYWMFKHFEPNTMEWTAFLTALMRDAGVAVWHTSQMDPGHRLGSILNGAYDLSHGLHAGIARKSFDGRQGSPDYTGGQWFLELIEARGGAPFIVQTAASLEGRHSAATCCNQFLAYLTAWGLDVTKYIAPLSTTSLLRNLILSGMTLINFSGDISSPSRLPTQPRQNHQEQDGVVAVVEALFALWLVSYVDREDYTLVPGDLSGEVWKLWLIGGAGMGLFAGFTGSFVAQCLAWAEDFERLGKTMLMCMLKMWVLFLPIMYSSREGDTDDGKFNGAGAAFPGYPPRATSPYLLPYAPGTGIHVDQGNSGAWSHNVPAGTTTVQTYAVDIALDQGTEILAARAGTVMVGTFEGAVDDSKAGLNIIIIRHDQQLVGGALVPLPAPLADHDVDAGDVPRFTYGVYLHGRQNSVTAAFNRHATNPVPGLTGVPGSDLPLIVGSTVRQGEPIMFAGDTGNSLHNHLHFQVQPELPGSSPTARNLAYTIPFVFNDVSGDGVLKAGRWYESGNARRT